MKSWYHNSETTGASLTLREIPVPVPKSGELLVQVHAASLNRGEFLARPSKSAGKPAGIECSGKIVEIGAQEPTSLKVGDRVMGRAAFAFSEYALMKTVDAVPVPDCFQWEDAACASITYQVAFEMLRLEGQLHTDEWLLITGITSGVGIAAMQLGQIWGARVIGTSRSQEKLKSLRTGGLNHGLLCPTRDFVDRLQEFTGGHGVDLIINNVGGSMFADCIQALAYRGRLATVGNLDGTGRAEIDLLGQHRKRLKLFGVSNKFRPISERAESVASFKREVVPYMDSGKLRPVIAKTLPFNDCNKAVDLMRSDSQTGKIAISF